jgi:ubiquinone/menaquinone biosynthesis C-methylase UbiE
MSRVAWVKPNFRADAFAGTASYYARYRVPYPEALLKDLLKRTGITGQGLLIDLACGPGRVALPLAGAFREVWAIDLEPGMIEVGQQEAKQRGVSHIQWRVGKAEDLIVPPASVEMTTIGEAFHRLDQQVVAERTREWLQPGGYLAVMGSYSLASEWEPWQRVVAEIALKWTGRHMATGGVSTVAMPSSGPDYIQAALREVGFEDVVSSTFVEPYDWSIETIVGNLFSTSLGSHHALGEKAAAFEADLRAALLAHDPGEHYHEDLRFGYTIGRRPVDPQTWPVPSLSHSPIYMT